ncbi:MAG: aminotransferase class V-fold PLP-dependent enzyme [Candidatus Campbellbacteria bacterium]|nr:aminotransferase class V-fold PLP-dependent enzyme [Candidatus Campbellbacteria bacterium]
MKDFKNDQIYLDYAASAPVRSEVLTQINDSLEHFANPSSIHKKGVEARSRIAKARKETAHVLAYFRKK